MADRNQVVIVFVTAPDVEAAERVARGLVEERLAACVNIVPGLRSIYWWEEEVQSSAEVLLLLKARRQDLAVVTQRVRELHPYTVPEVVAVKVEGGLDAYLAWVQRETERG